MEELQELNVRQLQAHPCKVDDKAHRKLQNAWFEMWYMRTLHFLKLLKMIYSWNFGLIILEITDYNLSIESNNAINNGCNTVNKTVC